MKCCVPLGRAVTSEAQGSLKFLQLHVTLRRMASWYKKTGEDGCTLHFYMLPYWTSHTPEDAFSLPHVPSFPWDSESPPPLKQAEELPFFLNFEKAWPHLTTTKNEKNCFFELSFCSKNVHPTHVMFLKEKLLVWMPLLLLLQLGNTSLTDEDVPSCWELCTGLKSF